MFINLFYNVCLHMLTEKFERIFEKKRILSRLFYNIYRKNILHYVKLVSSNLYFKIL